VEYLGEAVSFFRLVGDVNPAVFKPSPPSSWRCGGVRREHCFTTESLVLQGGDE